MQSMDWNDLRLFLAAADSCSVAGAARGIGMDASTLWRHLRRLERGIGVPLFVRNRSGYLLTDSGCALRDRLRQANLLIGMATDDCVERERLAGRLRLATSDVLVPEIVAPTLAALRLTQPRLLVEAAVSNEMVGLDRYEADLALRVVQQPQADLVGKRLGDVAFGIYGRPALLRKHARNLNDAPWIMPADRYKDFVTRTWLTEHFPGACPVCKNDSMLASVSLVESGAGVGMIPRFIGAKCRRLREARPPAPLPSLPLWLVYHPDQRRNVRLMLVAKEIMRVAKVALNLANR